MIYGVTYHWISGTVRRNTLRSTRPLVLSSDALNIETEYDLCFLEVTLNPLLYNKLGLLLALYPLDYADLLPKHSE